VWAKSNGNANNTYEAYAMSAAYNITGTTVSSVALSADKSSPQAINTTITWTATPTGGVAPIQYKWFIYDGTNWTAGNWTATNTFAWTPSTPGASYQIFVWAKSNGNVNNTYEAYAMSAAYNITGTTVSSVALSANKSSPQPINTTITWTATPTGGVAPIQYKWFIYDGTNWTPGNWTATNTFAWTPTTPGANYQIFVWAKSNGNVNNTYEAYAMSAAYNITGTTVTSVGLVANKTSPQVHGTTITWTATPSGGVTPYQYKWLIYDGASWTVGSWTATNTFAWTPGAIGSAYQIFVWVKSAGNAADTYEAYAMSPAFVIQ
jgi:cell wall-associated protease